MSHVELREGTLLRKDPEDRGRKLGTSSKWIPSVTRVDLTWSRDHICYEFVLACGVTIRCSFNLVALIHV